VEATHQQLATELGTAREVISRQLQDFQRRGWLKSGRGLISIQPDSPLHAFARSG
jgi:CRP/FNR family transcriptional regulator